MRKRKSGDEVVRSKLTIAPCTREEAKDYIRWFHRHNNPPLMSIFQVCVIDDTGHVCGVAMAGRPIARLLCDALTIEVSRIATDGTPNACSALLGACKRIAFALGYARIYTYTLEEEGGASLRGAGWRLDETKAGSWRGWNTPTRSRKSARFVSGTKMRWITENPKAAQTMPDFAEWIIALDA